MKHTLYQIADELRAVANLGLYYTKDGYDRQRYERVLGLSARILAVLEDRSPGEVLAQYLDNLTHFSPAAGAEAAVFQDGKLLLIQRHDTKLWAIPGGLVETGETLAEAALRELWEETRLRGRATQLLGIFDSRRWKAPTKHHLYLAIFQVETQAPVPARTPEALDARFFAEDELPPLDSWHHLRVPEVFKLHRGETPAPFFDLPLQGPAPGG